MQRPANFDMESALQTWRDEAGSLMKSEGLTLEEMERRLRETMVVLEESGLGPEETFLIATRRLAPLHPATAAAGNVDSVEMWRPYAFWMVAGCLLIQFWNLLSSQLIKVISFLADTGPGLFPWFYTVFFVLISVVPFAALWHLARRGRIQLPEFLRSLRGSHQRLFAWLALFSVVGHGCATLTSMSFGWLSPDLSVWDILRVAVVGGLLPTLSLVAALAWLMPRNSGDPLRS